MYGNKGFEDDAVKFITDHGPCQNILVYLARFVCTEQCTDWICLIQKKTLNGVSVRDEPRRDMLCVERYPRSSFLFKLPWFS